MKPVRSLITAFAFALMMTSFAKAEEVSLKLENGLTALGTMSLADGQSLDGGHVVLFVHGTLAHKDMDIVSTQQDLLNERDISVLAVNLTLGLDSRTGMYDCAVPHTHKHTDAVQEIAEWVAWLKGKGVAKVSLVGHSRGGNQVAWYAAEKPSPLVDKVVLIAPQTWTQDKDKKSYQARYKKDLAKVFATMKIKVDAGAMNEKVSGVDFIYCANTVVTPDSFVTYYQVDPRFNTPNLLDDIKVPVLVIAGSADDVVADLPAQMTTVNLDHVSYQLIEDAGHMFIDFAGEDLADAVSEFLAAE